MNTNEAAAILELASEFDEIKGLQGTAFLLRQMLGEIQRVENEKSTLKQAIEKVARDAQQMQSDYEELNAKFNDFESLIDEQIKRGDKAEARVRDLEAGNKKLSDLLHKCVCELEFAGRPQMANSIRNAFDALRAQAGKDGG